VFQGWNLSVFSNVDVLGYDDLGYAYSMRLCGVAAICSTTYGLTTSMLCQYPIAGTTHTGVNVATYNPTAGSTFSAAYNTPFTPSSGMTMNLVTGSCTANIQFICNPNGPAIPNTFQVVQTSATSQPCNVQLYVQTSIICATPSPALVGSTINNNCVFGGYNLAPLSTYDIYSSSPTQTSGYVLRLCGVQGNTYCNGLAIYGASTAMLCQYSVGSYALAVANYVNNSYGWSYLNGVSSAAGLELALVDGTSWSCGAAREGLIQIVCNPGGPALPTTMVSAQDATAQASCAYHFIIYTSLVCNSTQNVTGQANHELSYSTQHSTLNMNMNTCNTFRRNNHHNMRNCVESIHMTDDR
jgi:hypothetical protein